MPPILWHFAKPFKPALGFLRIVINVPCVPVLTGSGFLARTTEGAYVRCDSSARDASRGFHRGSNGIARRFRVGSGAYDPRAAHRGPRHEAIRESARIEPIME